MSIFDSLVGFAERESFEGALLKAQLWQSTLEEIALVGDTMEKARCTQILVEVNKVIKALTIAIDQGGGTHKEPWPIQGAG